MLANSIQWEAFGSIGLLVFLQSDRWIAFYEIQIYLMT